MTLMLVKIAVANIKRLWDVTVFFFYRITRVSEMSLSAVGIGVKELKSLKDLSMDYGYLLNWISIVDVSHHPQ